MDLRMMFDLDAENYDKFRPAYNDELFKDVILYSNLHNGSKALEIGIGTGQATRPFLETGCLVTAIEIGKNLARYSRNKFLKYNNLEIINQDFESAIISERAFDLVYSASAFHWIPLDTGLPKVCKILKSGKAFAWFSAHPYPAENDKDMADAIQNVYEKYPEYFDTEQQYFNSSERQRRLEESLGNRAGILKHYGFYDIVSNLYYSVRMLCAEDYVKLLETYSDHKAMPDSCRKPFMAEICSTIKRFGGNITLSYATLLCMGKNSN